MLQTFFSSAVRQSTVAFPCSNADYLVLYFFIRPQKIFLLTWIILHAQIYLGDWSWGSLWFRWWFCCWEKSGYIHLRCFEGNNILVIVKQTKKNCMHVCLESNFFLYFIAIEDTRKNDRTIVQYIWRSKDSSLKHSLDVLTKRTPVQISLYTDNIFK